MSYKMSHKKKNDDHSAFESLAHSPKNWLILVIPICIVLGLLFGAFFSTVSLFDISPDFYNRMVESEDVTLTTNFDECEIVKEEERYEKKALKSTKGSGGKTGGGGDPRAIVTKKGVLGIINGAVKGSSAGEVGSGTAGTATMGKGGYASGIDAVLQGTGGLKKGGSSESTGRRGTDGIGFGSAYGSGFGGSSGDVDDLLGSLMSGGGSAELKKRKPLKVKQSSGAGSAKMSGTRYASPRSSRSETVSYRPTGYHRKERIPAKENMFINTNNEAVSTFSIDVDDASYLNLLYSTGRNYLPNPENIRIEEMLNYFQYDYPEPSGSSPFSTYIEVASCPWNPENRLIHIGLKGRGLPGDTLPPSNFVFLVDVSGSMEKEERLPLVQQSLMLVVNQLRHQDRIAIVSYAEKAVMVLDATPGDQKEIILSAINNLKAGGNTAGNDGLHLAYQIANRNFISGGNNRVIVATDGDFNVGASSEEALVAQIEKRRSSGIFLTIFGFGVSEEDEKAMEQMANKGDGNYSLIHDFASAQKVCVDEMKGTFFAVGKDVKLQATFDPAAVESYRLIGYENRMLKKKDFADDTKDAGEIGAEQSVTALYEIVPKQRFSYPSTLSSLAIRYKERSETSKLITIPIVDSGRAIATSSDNFRFSAAVAQLGMILRVSQYAKNISYRSTFNLAKNAVGEDKSGLRREFCNLIRRCENLDSEKSVQQDNYAYSSKIDSVVRYQNRNVNASHTGGRSRANIMRVVRQNMASLKYAYNRRLKEKKDLKGKVTVKWAVDEYGKVIFVKVVSSTMKDPEFEQTVVTKMKRWAFGKIDKPGDVTEVVYPFVFTP